MKRFFKLLFIVIGIILLMTFIFPIAANIFNIGNIVGILAAFCFITLGVFCDEITAVIKFMCQSRGKKIFLCVFASAAAVCVLCFAVALGSVIAFSSTNADKQNTVIVLGCSVEGNKPSAQLTARVNAACKYLRKNENAVAVLSGGKGDGENISEAECMYDMMRQMGIDKDRLYLEEESENTQENIKNSLAVIEKNNLSDDIAIATSDYHLKRAIMIAEKNGVKNPGRIAASSGFFSIPTFYVRDTLGVMKEFVTG